VRGWRLKIAPRGRAAEGLAIDIAPWGRAAEGLAIDIAPCGRAAGRPPSWTSPCPPWTSPRPLRHMEDAMRRNKLALCLYLVWTTDEQDASAPAPAGARPQARQGRCQSLVREAVKEDSPAPAGARPQARQGRCQSLLLRDSAECKTTSRLLCCFISWTEFPARAHTSVHPFTLSSHVQPATCNGRPTSHVPPATCNLQPSSPRAPHLSPLASRLSPDSSRL
jgi:hypothetical protein